ncbi:MAG: hypothetical protein HQK81_09825 [Desulfovibrionaceae bacterium]|nr:hypothetical protein [Desulfovibrionaceae bacterium]MBF0514337.1 hypothetical protein [Desulfovibrionaceae bacterium]
MNPGAALPAKDLWLAALLSLAVFFAAHAKGFFNPFASNDDVRQQVFWMQKWSEPGLYPDDPFSDYAELYVPYGVKAVYRLAAPLIDPVAFSKALTGILYVFLGGCLWAVGFTLGGRGLGWTAACVYWLTPSFLHNMSGGLSRSFASPLLALFMLCWLRRNARGMGLTLALEALFIPYICILSTGACLLAALAGRRRADCAPPFPARPAHLLWTGLVAGVVWLMGRQFDAAGYGPLVSAADMAGRPEFGPLGRFELYPQPGLFFDALYYPFERIGLFLDAGLATGVVSLVAIAGLAWIFGRRADWRGLGERGAPFFFLLAASAGLYALARVFILKLFVPDRYLSYTLYMVYCLLLAVCFHAGLARALAAPKKAAAVVLLAAALSFPRLRGLELYDYSGDAPLYRAAWETPKDALFAGEPHLMDNLLTFGKRKVFVSYKLAHPWSKGWWEFVRPRLVSLFRAYYASDPRAVRDFCRENRIDFLVVDPAGFTPEFLRARPFFAPFDALIRELTQGRSEFALLDEREFPYTGVGGGLRLIDMRGQEPGREKSGEPGLAGPQPGGYN